MNKKFADQKAAKIHKGLDIVVMRLVQVIAEYDKQFEGKIMDFKFWHTINWVFCNLTHTMDFPSASDPQDHYLPVQSYLNFMLPRVIEAMEIHITKLTEMSKADQEIERRELEFMERDLMKTHA